MLVSLGDLLWRSSGAGTCGWRPAIERGLQTVPNQTSESGAETLRLEPWPRKKRSAGREGKVEEDLGDFQGQEAAYLCAACCL